MQYEVVAPDAAGTIESLSSLGYSPESAVADIVDNSIDATATVVDIDFHWAGPNSFVTITDNGQGMTEAALVKAMTIAAKGPGVDRADTELGRFGMGLKTASFSQASRLVVWSKAHGHQPAARIWDLDHVISTGSWQLLSELNDADRVILGPLQSQIKDSGTVVAWRHLTTLVDELADSEEEQAHFHFFEAIERVEKHLAMTFARFLLGAVRKSQFHRIELRINGREVKPWDPFLEQNKSTLPKQVEELEVGGHGLTIRPFVLPPKRLLSDEEYLLGAGPRGWLEQQGFYLYRNDRLILSGSWLDFPGMRKDEKHLLARIAIEIPSALDKLWSVDIRKASARPPLPLRNSLRLTAKATRADALRRLSAISRTTTAQKTDELSYVWGVKRRNGELRLDLNWSHPLVQHALQSSPDARPVVHALLKYMEETVPIPALRAVFDSDQDRDHVPFSDSPPQEVIGVAERLYSAYINKGLTPAQAKKRLEHTPPFNEYPDLSEMLNLPSRKSKKREPK